MRINILFSLAMLFFFAGRKYRKEIELNTMPYT